MSAFFRKRIERTIEHMIQTLDEMDGDPDLETEPIEEQHDCEADPAEDGLADQASAAFILAETDRQRRRLRD
jgi:hypothetical protein